jgi:hypothetical protein
VEIDNDDVQPAPEALAEVERVLAAFLDETIPVPRRVLLDMIAAMGFGSEVMRQIIADIAAQEAVTEAAQAAERSAEA